MSKTITASRTTLYGVISLCFSLLVGLLFMSGMGKAQEPLATSDPITVQAATLQWQQQYEKIQRVVGRVEASQQARIGFELSGMVNTVHVDDGAIVKQGDTLATLDTDILESQLTQALASVEKAEAQARLAKSSMQRIIGLVKAKVESQQRLDEAQQSLDVANASVREAQSTAHTLTVNLTKSTLTAPFDGEVVSRLVDQGTVVSQGQPVFEVVSQHQREVRIPVPDKLLEHLVLGQEYSLKDNQKRYSSILKSIGKYRRIDTRTVDAIFELTSSDSTQLLPGDLLTLDVKIEVAESGAWVPMAALSHGIRGLWTVYSVQQGEPAKVVSRSVEVLYSDGQYAFIRGAIEPMMQVVITGAHRLAPGQNVAVTYIDKPDYAGQN